MKPESEKISFTMLADGSVANFQGLSFLGLSAESFPLEQLRTESGPWHLVINHTYFVVSKTTKDSDIFIEAHLDAVAEAKANLGLRLSLRGANIAFWDWDLTNDTLQYDSTWFNQIDVTGDSSKVGAWMECLHPDDYEPTANRIQAHLKGESTSYEAIMRLRAKNGTYRFVLTRGKIMEYDQNKSPTRFCGTHVDLTEMFELKEQLIKTTKLASLGNLASGLAHKINTPLATILTATEVIKKATKDPVTNKMISHVTSSVDKISSIMQAFKFFTQKGSEEAKTPQALLPILEMAKSLCTKQNLIILDKDIPSTAEVYGNPAELSTALMCVIQNGVEALDLKHPGLVNISVTETPTEWEVRIRNNGQKLTVKEESLMFEPFFTSKTKGWHNGLGLTTAKNIVENHHGKVFFEKEDGETCFCFQLKKEAA